MKKPNKESTVNYLYLDGKPVLEIDWDIERQCQTSLHSLAKWIIHRQVFGKFDSENYLNALAALLGYPGYQAWPKERGVEFTLDSMTVNIQRLLSDIGMV